MVTNPSDFDSYAWGVELNSANYSGGAGGTFTDLVRGAGYWTVASATPTFATRNGLEGMEFNNDAAENVSAKNYAVGECTVVLIFDVDTSASWGMWGPDDNNPGATLFNYQLQCIDPTNGASGYASFDSSRAVVGAVSACPENNTNYVTTYDGTLRKNSGTKALNALPKLLRPDTMYLGRRWTRMDGWIAEAYGFHKSLHFRDETALDDMLQTLAAKIGL